LIVLIEAKIGVDKRNQKIAKNQNNAHPSLAI